MAILLFHAVLLSPALDPMTVLLIPETLFLSAVYPTATFAPFDPPLSENLRASNPMAVLYLPQVFH